MTVRTASRRLGLWLALLALAFVALQVFFVLRIAVMAWIDPQSTAFQRSEAWRILSTQGSLPWSQTWVPSEQLSPHLKRAVIAAEDADFVNHDGVEWDAINRAWTRNAKAQEQAAKRAAARLKAGKAPPVPKVIGGSTITQQLAKNLLLSGERNFVRKGQEFVLTQALELFLTKQRILELYLNSVEWGAGVFGAEAAARHYFRKPASALGPSEAARLAVMLPRPKFFEQNPYSPYLQGRTATIAARLRDAELP